MTPEDLIAAFEAVSEAPDGVVRLRELVLQLAVRGRLVPQEPGDEPASELLERVASEKARLVAAKEIKKPKKVPPIEDVAVPFTLPPTWTWARFVDIANIASDLVKPAEYLSAPHVAPNNIEKATGRLLPFQTVGEDGVKSAKHRFKPGQILYSKIRPNLSKVVTVDFDGLCSADMYPIDPWVNRGYLHRYMLSAAFVDQATDDDNRLAMPKLNQEQLSAVLVAVPPLAEQHRIVAKVDELMALLDRLEAARDSREATRVALRDAALAALRDADSAEEVDVAWQCIAERMDDLFTDPADVAPLRQAVLQLAVRGRLVPQDAGDEPANVLLERVVAEKATGTSQRKKRGSSDKSDPDPPILGGHLPAGWAYTRLMDLIAGTGAGWSPKCDAHPTNSEAEWGVLKTTAVQPNRYLSEHHKALPGKLSPRPNLEVHAGDLLVTRAGPYYRVGVAAFVGRTRPRLMLSDKVIRCSIPPTSAHGEWLAMVINSGPGADFIRGKQTGMDAAQMNISQSRLALTPVLLPPLAEQQRILAKVDELMALADRLEAGLNASETSHAAFAAAAVHHLDA